MRRCPTRGTIFITLTLAAALSAVSGCSDATPGTPGGQSGRSAGATPSSARSSAAPAPGAVGVSPGGVTTRVDVPAESTEEEYFQACHAAKTWMDTEHSDAGAIEPYLAMIQAAGTGVAGTWNVRWADLTPARQAAVIVAATAAARGECG